MICATLYSNGIFETTEDGTSIPKFCDRFCNVWPELSKALKKEREETGGVTCLYIGDWWGGRTPCTIEALDKFYEDQFTI